MKLSKQMADLMFLQGRTVTIATPYQSIEWSNLDAPTLDDILDMWYFVEEELFKFYLQGSLTCAKL